MNIISNTYLLLSTISTRIFHAFQLVRNEALHNLLNGYIRGHIICEAWKFPSDRASLERNSNCSLFNRKIYGLVVEKKLVEEEEEEERESRLRGKDYFESNDFCLFIVKWTWLARNSQRKRIRLGLFRVCVSSRENNRAIRSHFHFQINSFF